jgi:hypothetical protein
MFDHNGNMEFTRFFFHHPFFLPQRVTKTKKRLMINLRLLSYSSYSRKLVCVFIFQADWVASGQLPDHSNTDLETKKRGYSGVSSAVADFTPGHPAVSSAVADLTPGHHHHSWVSTQLDEQKKNHASIHGFLATLHTMKI